jgi:hypothetical protein
MIYAQAFRIYEDFCTANISIDKYPPYDRGDTVRYFNELFKNKNIFDTYPTDLIFKSKKISKIDFIRSLMIVSLLANPKDDIVAKLFRILEPNNRSTVSKKIIDKVVEKEMLEIDPKYANVYASSGNVSELISSEQKDF